MLNKSYSNLIPFPGHPAPHHHPTEMLPPNSGSPTAPRGASHHLGLIAHHPSETSCIARRPDMRRRLCSWQKELGTEMALRSAASRDAQPPCPCLRALRLAPVPLPAPPAGDGGRQAAGVTPLPVCHLLGRPSWVPSTTGQRQSWTPDACIWARVFTLPDKHPKTLAGIKDQRQEGNLASTKVPTDSSNYFHVQRPKPGSHVNPLLFSKALALQCFPLQRDAGNALPAPRKPLAPLSSHCQVLPTPGPAAPSPETH